MSEHKSRQKKHDAILAAVLLVLAAVLGGGYYLTHRIPAMRAEVTVDGELVETLDLSRDQEITIHGARDGVNVLVVKDGEIWCEKASCPDQVCVRQGKQSRDGEMIICLPSLMIVQVKGAEQ